MYIYHKGKSKKTSTGQFLNVWIFETPDLEIATHINFKKSNKTCLGKTSVFVSDKVDQLSKKRQAKYFYLLYSWTRNRPTLNTNWNSHMASNYNFLYFNYSLIYFGPQLFLQILKVHKKMAFRETYIFQTAPSYEVLRRKKSFDKQF